MKKMILVMVILLLAVPAMAEVKITCEQSKAPGFDNQITVRYDASTEPNLPRAFALDITLVDTLGADNAVISTVTAAVTGESNSVSGLGYGIFLGSDGIDINATTGDINMVGRGYGSPVANPGDPGAATGLGTKSVTVELASLYGGTQGPANADSPASSGVLLTFTVNNKACAVVITENTDRGGIVMENPDEVVDVNLPGVGATVAADITCPADICGTGFAARDGFVSFWDFARLSSNYPPNAVFDWRADICGGPPATAPYGPPDGLVSFWDFSKLSQNYPVAPATVGTDWR